MCVGNVRKTGITVKVKFRGLRRRLDGANVETYGASIRRDISDATADTGGCGEQDLSLTSANK